MTYSRNYEKGNGEGIWVRKLLSSNLEISCLGQTRMKFELGEVSVNLVMDEGCNCKFYHLT